MDEVGCVNIFLSEGVAEVVAELEAAALEVPVDPFGHVQLDKVNPGAWFGKQCTEYAVDAALRGESGLVGEDEERANELRTSIGHG